MLKPLSIGSNPKIPLFGRTLRSNAANAVRIIGLLAAALWISSAPISGAEITRIPPKELRRMQLNKEKGYVLIDVRIKPVYDDGHIQGAANVPLDVLSGWRPPADKRIVVYCPSNSCPTGEQAVGILEDRGIANVVLLDGGYALWKEKGYPIVRLGGAAKAGEPGRMDAKKARALMKEKALYVLDVRPEKEFKAGRLPGAVNIPLESLAERLKEVPKESPLLVYDRAGKRSREAAKLLCEAGYEASELKGGLSVWAALKFPLEVK